jgi:hypothetical protein
MKSVQAAVVDQKTGLPVRDDAGEIVTQAIDPQTGAPVAKKGKPVPSAEAAEKRPATRRRKAKQEKV